MRFNDLVQHSLKRLGHEKAGKQQSADRKSAKAASVAKKQQERMKILQEKYRAKLYVLHEIEKWTNQIQHPVAFSVKGRAGRSLHLTAVSVVKDDWFIETDTGIGRSDVYPLIKLHGLKQLCFINFKDVADEVARLADKFDIDPPDIPISL